MFQLSQLLNCEEITIQCHNVPDADSIASAFAIFSYLAVHGKQSKIIYSGNMEITKSNLLEMIILLSIPIQYVREKTHLKTLVMADCQYGERNAEQFEADTIVVIDHHKESTPAYDMGIIHSQLGSCSTLVWDLLVKEQFDFKQYPDVSTALYYGLFTDTGNLEEIAHPLDKDARDSLKFDPIIIKRLRGNNLTLSELKIAANALNFHNLHSDLRYASFEAEPCDPNILGFISDLALQVRGIDVCIAYTRLPSGYKLSVRSCVREVMANEFVQFITEDVGSGGGHLSKAGGFIDKAKLENPDISDYLETRSAEYFTGYDLIDTSSHNLNIDTFSKYKKNKIPVGFVVSTDIFKDGTPMLIRTLEGDAEAEASDDVYLMIGIYGEVYPITAEKFKRNYELYPGSFQSDFDYSPTVKNKVTGDSVELAGYAKACISTGNTYIYAAPLTRKTKIFTGWNPEGYMSGKPGDYIAVRADDHNDVYIIQKDIFAITYTKEIFV